MAWLRSPDGADVEQVPDELVPHYVSLGAKIVGPPEQGLEANPISPIDLAVGLAPVPKAFALGGAAARSLDALLHPAEQAVGSAAARVAGPVATKAGAIGRAIASEIPVVGRLFRAKQLMNELSAAGEGAGSAAGRVRPTIPQNATEVAGGPLHLGEMPAPDPAPIPEPIATPSNMSVARGGPLDIGEAPAGAAQGRVVGEIKPVRKPVRPKGPKGSAKSRTTESRPSRPMQGKSKPKLEREAKARAAVKESGGKPAIHARLSRIEDFLRQHAVEPGPVRVPGEAPQVALHSPEDDLSALLRHSHEMETEMAQAGLTEAEKAHVRAQLRAHIGGQ